MRSTVPAFLAALCGLAFCIPALAQATTPPAEHDFGKSVDDARLAASSGGTEVTNRMTLNGTVGNNSADHLFTGDNAISGTSFQGSAGLPTVIQNTGNNVLIQNATIVNVQFQP